jgi:shikimate kinase
MERQASYQSADAYDGWGEQEEQPPVEKQSSVISTGGGAVERDEVDKVLT